MAVYGTSIVQGSCIIQKRKVHGYFNCLVVPDGASEDWYFKQFPTEQHIYEFAQTYNLAVSKEEDHGIASE